MKLPVNTKPWVQGAFVGAVAAMIVGFSWGGWVTGGTSNKKAAEAAHDATVMALAPICAEKFRAQTDATAKIVELTKASTWERGNIVEKAGFAKVPGNMNSSDIARACGEILATPQKT